MKDFYCKRCGFSGTRLMVRGHLREEHNLRKKGKLNGEYFSINKNGIIRQYNGVKLKK